MPRREVVVYKVCDMPHEDARGRPREVEATHVAKFAHNGYRWEMDLCDECDTRLFGQVMAFADHAVKVGEPTVFDRVAPVRAVRVPSPALAQRPAPPPVAAEQRRQEALAREELPKTAERWQLTDHALERMQERRIDLYEVLMAAERPEHVGPRTSAKAGRTRDPRMQERYRGDIKLIVDPEKLEVHTVARQSERDDLITSPPLTTTNKKASA